MAVLDDVKFLSVSLAGGGPAGGSADLLSLDALVAMLGTASVRVASAPAGLKVGVAGPCLYDAADPSALGRGDLVLGINIAAGQFVSLLRDAHAAGATAVAVRDEVLANQGTEEWQAAAPLAVLAVPPAVTWDQFLTVVRSAVAVPSRDGVEDAPIGALFALSDAVAALVGGAVTIEDAASNLLAYSNLDQPVDEPRLQTILGRRLPAVWAERLREEGIFPKLVALPQSVVRIADPKGVARPRWATAIRAGSEVLGYMWVLLGDKEPGPDVEAAVLESTRVAALHLLRHRASDDLNRHERGSLLQDLFEGRRDAREAAARLGIPLDSPCAVVAFRLTVDDDIELSLKRARTVDLIAVACQAFRRQVAVTAVGHTVYALFPSLDEKASERLVNFVRSIAEQSREALRDRLLVGIGSTVAGLDAVSGSRNEADRAVQVLLARNDPKQTVALIDDVRTSSVMLALAEFLMERPDLGLPGIDQLAAYDRRHSKEYLPTLRAFVAASFDVNMTAQHLGLHPNSVRYRLRRIEEITGMSLAVVDNLVALTLQLGPLQA